MDKLLPCPFCGSQNIDPEGWMCSDRRCGPACDDCAGSADTVELWNSRPLPAQEWQDISTAPKDGRWIIARCNDHSQIFLMSWGCDRIGRACWCSQTGSYGDGLFTPHGGWIPAPQPVAIIAEERGTK